jgi:hypothetical protein
MSIYAPNITHDICGEAISSIVDAVAALVFGTQRSEEI